MAIKQYEPKFTRGSSISDAQLKEVFVKHDKNCDKCLSKEELKGAFKELGVSFPKYRASMALMFADANGDGVITDDEINRLVLYVRLFVNKFRA